MNLDFDFSASGIRTIHIEQQAIGALKSRIGDDFIGACKYMLACEGRIVITGMGKSGHIGKKIAATLASTGTPSFFVHPGEASHGDMGMITKNDVVIAMSNSGETAEVTSLLPLLKRLHIPVISMTGKPDSTLAMGSHCHLDTSVAEEACPLNLAPTSSTTAALVMGDALAIALLEARGFTAEEFAFSHPGGSLGRRLLLKVETLMHSGDEMPRVLPSTPLAEALMIVTSKGLGMTTVIDQQGQLQGVFTDGDLRRAIDNGVDIRQSEIASLMTVGGKTTSPDLLAAEALTVMEDNQINALVAMKDGLPVGVITMHDMLKAGVI
jgi:arabinose-5-phosphate isomerase